MGKFKDLMCITETSIYKKTRIIKGRQIIRFNQLLQGNQNSLPTFKDLLFNESTSQKSCYKHNHGETEIHQRNTFLYNRRNTQIVILS